MSDRFSLWRWAAKQPDVRNGVGLGTLAAAGGAAAGMCALWIVAKIVDAVIMGQGQSKVGFLCALLLGVAFVAQGLDALARLWWQDAAGKAAVLLQRTIVEGYFSQRFTSEPRVDAGTALGALASTAPALGSAVRSMAENSAALLRLTVVIAAVGAVVPAGLLAVGAVAVLSVVVSILLQRPLDRAAKAMRDSRDSALSTMRGALGILREASQWRLSWAMADEVVGAGRTEALALKRLGAMRESVRATGLLYWMSTASLYWWLSPSVDSGSATIGEVTALVAYVGSVQQPLAMLVSAWGELRVITATERKLSDTLELLRDDELASLALPRGDQRGDLPVVALLQGNVCVGGGRRVLQGVDFVIRHGEIVALVGPSGSGKSTLLETLACMRPVDGCVYILGRPSSSYTVDELRSTICMVFQDPDRSPAIAARVLQRLSGRNGAEAFRLSPPLLASLRQPRGDAYAGRSMSSGEAARVQMWHAFSHNPRLVLLDEPTGALDPPTARAVWRTCCTHARERGIALFVATHDESILGECDRVLTIDGGTLRPLPCTGRVPVQ